MKHSIKHKKLLFITILFIPFSLLSQTEQSEFGMPDYVKDDWESQIGIWITSNKEYKSEVEPYDEYGLDWKYGFANKTLLGRLYCIQDGKDIGSVWDFYIYWDIKDQEIKMIQTGVDGAIGKGNNKRLEDGSWKSSETFHGTDGSSFQSGHQVKLIDGKRHTRSFNIVDGEWQERRFYVWERKNNH